MTTEKYDLKEIGAEAYICEPNGSKTAVVYFPYKKSEAAKALSLEQLGMLMKQESVLNITFIGDEDPKLPDHIKHLEQTIKRAGFKMGDAERHAEVTGLSLVYRLGRK